MKTLEKLAVAGAGVGLLVLLFKSSGSKAAVGGLGNINTARTSKGRKSQRAAVFAKLDDEGKTWPKKNGTRKKPRSKKRK